MAKPGIQPKPVCIQTPSSLKLVTQWFLLMKRQWTWRPIPSSQLCPSEFCESEVGEVTGNQGPILAIWWLLMAGIFCAGSRIVGSNSVSNFFLGRTGLSINKSTCYVRTSGFSDLIQALLTWYESDEWLADSHCQSIKGTLCPSPVSLGTVNAVLLLFTGLPVEGNSCRFSHFFGNGRMRSDFRGSCCLQASPQESRKSEGP